MKKVKGFTLVELVLVILILGILAAVIMPRSANLRVSANEAAENTVVAAVKSGIRTAHSYCVIHGKQGLMYNGVLFNPQGNPANLDNAPATSTASPPTPYFNLVLEQGGITNGKWSKTGNSFRYKGPAGNSYFYNAQNGTFLKE